MRFGNLVIRNFLSFGDTPQVFDLDRSGVVLIDGQNGQGKSAIPEALLWCLYGETVRGYKDDRVIHRWGARKNCEVAQELRSDDGVAYTVVRARKSDTFASRVHLFRGTWSRDSGTSLQPSGPFDLSAGHQDETQAKIDALLGMGKVTFRATVLFGQSDSYRFTRLTDGKQKDILDDALGMKLYKQAARLASEEEDRLALELRTVEEKRERLMLQRHGQEQVLEELQEANRVFSEEQRRRTEEALATYRAAIKEHSAACKVANLRLVRQKDEHAIRERLEDLDAQWSDVEAKAAVFSATVSARLQQAEEARDRARRIYRDREPTCTKCGQAVTEAALHSHLSEVLREVTPAVHEARRAERAEVRWRRRIESLRREARKLGEELRAAESLAMEAESALKELPRLSEAIVSAGKAHAAVKAQANGYPAKMKAVQQRLDTIDREVEELRCEAKRLTTEQQRCRFWMTGFGAKGLRSLLLDSAVPVLNQKAAECAAVLSGSTIAVEFRTQRLLKDGRTVDDFHVHVDNTDGAEDYDGDSGGEKGKVDLVVGLALQKLVSSRATAQIPLAFFDEVFDALDAEATDVVAAFMAEELKSRRGVFLISHRPEVKDYFPQTVTVIKRGRVSRIVE